jgi:hydrogenase expression/formation protein HypC
MCLGVPGEIVELLDSPIGMTMGKVSFGGIVKEVCLAYTPEVGIGDYVVVHVGFAISTIDKAEAHKVFEYLKEMGELEELQVAQPGDNEQEAES